jgi:hypothetical protein
MKALEPGVWSLKPGAKHEGHKAIWLSGRLNGKAGGMNAWIWKRQEEFADQLWDKFLDIVLDTDRHVALQWDSS